MQIAIDVEATMDRALSARVNAALTNHRWAELAQPLHYQESSAQLQKAKENLELAAAKQAECMELAKKHGWI